LERVTEQTKIMLDSWQVNTNNTNKTISQYLNPIIPLNPQDSMRQNQISREDYLKHSWLFGK